MKSAEGWEDVEDVFCGAMPRVLAINDESSARVVNVSQGRASELGGRAMSRLRDLLHELADNVADKLESLSGDARYYEHRRRHAVGETR